MLAAWTPKILAFLSILTYGISIYFLNRKITAEHAMVQRILYSNVSAVVLHGFFIATLLNSMDFRDLNFLVVLSIIAWLLGLFSISRGQQLASLMLRPAIFGFALVSVALVLFFASPSTQATGSMTWGLAIHIVLSLLAFSLLSLATLYALQILHLNKVLKERTARALDERLPPLMAVEQYFFRLLTTGTIVLTGAIAAGFLFIDDLFASEQLHKTILSLAAWVCFGSLVLIHSIFGSRGRPVVIWTLIASIILTLGYFGSRIVRDVIVG